LITIIAAMAAIPGAVTIAGMASGKTAIAREGCDGLVTRSAVEPGAPAGVCMIMRSAWYKRIMPEVIKIAGGETCQFVRTNGPSKATPRTMAVAIAIARQATVCREAGSVPRVTLANGRIALSGPRVRKKRMPMSP
jgi:hypothetical protein